MSVDNKVPEIRFKGFNKEWNHLTLGENAKFTKGQGYSKGDLVTSGAPIILYGRLYTRYQTVITSVDTFVTEKDKSVKSIGGEVIVPASGESPEDISRASVVSEPNVILGGDLNIVLPSKKIHSTFLALAISNGRLKSELSSKAQGKSVVHIRNSDLADLGLILPIEYIEQTTIGNYFQKLDTLINQHQQQHDKLSNIKKAMLEKMFPKQGETMPEIRFKGFGGEWEGVTLGDYTTFRRGSFPQPYGNKEWYNGEGSMPFVQVIDVSKGLSLVEDTKQKISIKAQPRSVFVPKGSVVVTLQGTIGRVAITQFDSFVDRTILIFEHFSRKTDSSFWAYTIQNKFDLEKKRAPGGTIKTITKDALSSFDVLIPSTEEQTIIGNYFQKLDNLINQHQQQITKLNNIKQACLSKMFV